MVTRSEKNRSNMTIERMSSLPLGELTDVSARVHSFSGIWVSEEDSAAQC
jgi:hypothetical protein